MLDDAVHAFIKSRKTIPFISLFTLEQYNMPFALDDLAYVYHQWGDLNKAILEYKRIMTVGADIKNRRLINPKYYYMLAKLYEEQGNTARVVAHYEKFLDLWKDADPGIPEVENARKRLAELKQKN